jgi:amino acid transporter
MKKKVDSSQVIFILALLAISIVFFFMAVGYSYNGKLFPLIIIGTLVPMLILKIIGFINPKIAAHFDVRGIDLPGQKPSSTQSKTATEEISDDDIAKWPRELAMGFWLVSLISLIYLVGFLLTVPLFLVLFLRFQGRHSWLVSGVTSLAVLAFIYVLFGILLSTPFPEGLVFLE